MSYSDSAFYVAETNRKNRPKAPLKPFVGILSGNNAPLIKSNDKHASIYDLAFRQRWQVVALIDDIISDLDDLVE